MLWTKREIKYLEENYPKKIPVEEIAKFLGRAKRAVSHKATRMKISRPRFVFNKKHKKDNF